MWYYAKDQKKIGPISDAAVADLLKRGKIDKHTKVWSPSQKTWCVLEQSSIYGRLRKGRTSQHLLLLNKSTYIFRAMLVVLAVCLGYRIFFLYEALNTYETFINLDSETEILKISLICAENTLLNRLISFIIFLLSIVTAFAGFKWMKIVANTAGTISKNYPYSVAAATWIFFIPILNIIVPYKVVLDTIIASLRKKGFKIWYFTLVFIWGIFWFLSIVLFFSSNYLIPEKCMPDEIQSFYFAKILVSLIYVSAVIMTIILISFIYNLQKRYFTLRG